MKDHVSLGFYMGSIILRWWFDGAGPVTRSELLSRS